MQPRRTLAAAIPFSSASQVQESVLITPLAPAHFALVFGCQTCEICTEMALRAAQLYSMGIVPKILVSGGVRLENGLLEADYIRGILMDLGVPSKDIYRERASTNTLENAKFSHAIAPLLGLPQRANIILINQRYASLRGAMTMAAQWPESLCMTSPVNLTGTPFKNWRKNPLMVALMTRELKKIRDYRARGDIADIDLADLNRRIHTLQRKGRVMRNALPLAS